MTGVVRDYLEQNTADLYRELASEMLEQASFELLL